MPLYEYKCSDCGAIFEVLQKITDAPLTKCIKCGGPVKKLISSPAIQFKGSGWYITDYAHKNSPAPNGNTEKNVHPAAETTKGSAKSEKK